MRKLTRWRRPNSPRIKIAGRIQAPAIVLAALLLSPSNCPANTTSVPATRTTSAHPSRAAKCEKAFRAEWRRALAEQDEGHPPRACKGVPQRTLNRIIDRVIREETPALPRDEEGR